MNLTKMHFAPYDFHSVQHSERTVSFGNLFLQLNCLVGVLRCKTLRFQEHDSNQEFPVAQFADIAAQPFAFVVELSLGEYSGLSETVFADRATAELTILNLLFFLESDHFAGLAVRFFVHGFVWSHCFEDCSSFTKFVINVPDSECLTFFVHFANSQIELVNFVL